MANTGGRAKPRAEALTAIMCAYGVKARRPGPLDALSACGPDRSRVLLLSGRGTLLERFTRGDLVAEMVAEMETAAALATRYYNQHLLPLRDGDIPAERRSQLRSYRAHYLAGWGSAYAERIYGALLNQHGQQPESGRRIAALAAAEDVAALPAARFTAIAATIREAETPARLRATPTAVSDPPKPPPVSVRDVTRLTRLPAEITDTLWLSNATRRAHLHLLTWQTYVRTGRAQAHGAHLLTVHGVRHTRRGSLTRRHSAAPGKGGRPPGAKDRQPRRTHAPR